MDEVLRTLLDCGLNVRFRVQGSSMSPGIRPGDTITLEPVALREVQRGDILACKSLGRLVVHRATEVTSRTVTIRGDAPGSEAECVDASGVLGRVVGLERRRRPIPVPAALPAGLRRVYGCLVQLKAICPLVLTGYRGRSALR